MSIGNRCDNRQVRTSQSQCGACALFRTMAPGHRARASKQDDLRLRDFLEEASARATTTTTTTSVPSCPCRLLTAANIIVASHNSYDIDGHHLQSRDQMSSVSNRSIGNLQTNATSQLASETSEQLSSSQLFATDQRTRRRSHHHHHRTAIARSHNISTRSATTTTLLLTLATLNLLITQGQLHSSNGRSHAQALAQSYGTHDLSSSTLQQAAAASAAATSSTQESNPQPAASTASASAACFGGLQTFEKISMSSFENPSAGSSSGAGAGAGTANSNSAFDSGILVQQDDQALTSECINLCRSQSNCLSFVIDYNKFECKSYATTQQELQQEFAAKFQSARAATSGSGSGGGSGATNQTDSLEGNSQPAGGYQASASSSSFNFQQLLPSTSSNYFEKVCLDGVANRNQFSDVCGPGRLWTVERVVDSFLDGFVEKEVTNVNNKDECSKLCLFETQFVCRSADYDTQARLCRLSKEDRRTQPQAMRYVGSSGRQYLENQCATPGPSSCVYETKRNVGIISMDALKFAQTAQDCQMKCNQEISFNCRSYSFHQQRCFLSGDDSTSLNSNLIKLPAKQGWAFGEKKCLVELCTKGIFTYERIAGYTLRSALSTSIDLMMPGGSSPPSAFAGETLQPEASNKMRPRHLMPPGARAHNGSSSSLASAMMMMMMSPAQSNQQVVVASDPLQESASSRHTRASGGSNLAITEHCRHSCDLGYLNCPAFTVDYKNNRCQRLDRNSQGRHQELVARDGFAYYEKICLRVPEIMSMCQDKYWIFERVLGHELAPRLYDKSLKFVQSRRDCEEYCLEEKQFQCRSALYNDETSDCKLSRLNRRLALQEGGLYRNFNARISYLENNCVRDHQLERKQCHYEQTKDEPAYPTFTERIEMALPAAAASQGATTEMETGGYNKNVMRTGGHHLHNSSANQMRQGSAFCEQLCNDNSKFECHAFGYYASTAQCFLSGDDSISAGDMASTPSTGFRYYEKKCRLGFLSANNTTGGAGGEGEGEPPGAAPQELPGNQNLNPYLQPPMDQEPAIGTTTPTMNEFQTGAGDTQPQPPSTPAGGSGSGASNLTPANTIHQRPPPPTLTMSHNNSAQEPPNNQNYDSDAYKCGAGHTFVYQRISGFEPIGGYLTLLTKNNDHPGIVAECSELCRRAYECRAFVVDYASNQCYAMLENSSVGLLSLRQILGKDYFEGFCVASHLLLMTTTSVNTSSCRNKTWIMDKIVDQAVVGVQYSKLIPDSDRAQCRQACLEERLFMCKSAMYDSASGECKLYSIDRESVPQMRLIFTKGVDFFENQCQITSSSCPYDAIERDMTIITVTKSVQARSTFDCELACNSELGFNCRSYTYLDQYPSLPNLCLLSSDSRSTSQRGSVKEHQRTLYAERNCYYRRPRFPGGGSSGHKLDHGYSPPLFLGAGTSTGQDSSSSLSSPLRPAPPISPLMVDPYGGAPIQAHHQPERTSGNSQQSNTEQEGGPAPHEFPTRDSGLATGQGACEPHQFTFERTFGYDFKLAPKERAPIAPTIGIAIGCQEECLRRGDKCQSFVVDYALPYQSCFLLDTQAGANKRALARAPNSAYFEKVCLPRTGLLQVDLPLTTANSNSEPTTVHDHQMLPPPAPLTMLQRLQQLYQPATQSGSTTTTLVAPPMSEPLDSLQSLDISPSYSHEPWSLKHPHDGQQQQHQQPPAHASQLPYYLQQQQLVRNYPSRSCAKLWTFERFVNYNFTAPVDKLLEDSLTRAQCETACLNEASFSCRAATYDYANKLCRLFKNTRRTIMSQFIDLNLPSNGASGQVTSAPGQMMNSHPGTAHVLDSTGGAAATADNIQAAASTTNDLDGASSRRQSGLRQLNGVASSQTTGNGQHAQQQVSPTAGGTHATAEPLNPSKNIDYLENTCTPEPSSCQYRQVYDQFSPYIDKVVHAKTLAECQRQCDQERLFSCKSVNYDPSSRNCMLVNEDLISLTRGGGGGSTGGANSAPQTPLLPKKNAIYSEKGNCEMISVQCSSQEMLVTINFDSPFRGRIMAKGNPEQCYSLGDGQTSMQFPIVFGPKCNSRQEGHNTFVNEVVIQQHPVIMTESDKTVRVMCAFEAPEQTITLSKNHNSARGDNKTMVGIDVGTPDTSRTRHDKQQFNSVVSSKAAPPSVMLRILDQAGRDASMINLGDDLMLKIQMHAQAPEGAKSSGALGIFARNLAARSSNGESLLLIDNEGCPVDPQVFPALEIDPKDGKSLSSTFKAFRFPSSGLVNFEVQIRFCPERCQPVDCHGASPPHKSRSYGRRRRRRKRQVTGAQDEQQVVAGRAAILQSVDQIPQQDQPPAAPTLPTLDSLSTVMKPGKAFEYVRKLMLPRQQQEQLVEQSSHSESGPVPVNSSQEVTSQQAPDDSNTGQPAIGGQAPRTNIESEQQQQQQQQNEDFDSHALAPAQGPSQDEQTGGAGQFSPPDVTSSSQSQLDNGGQFVPMAGSSNGAGPVRATSERPTITMHVDARVVPAQPPATAMVAITGDQFAARPNFNQLNLAPYGHFQTSSTRVVTPPGDLISAREPTRTTNDGSDPQQQAGHHDQLNSISPPPAKSSELADETVISNSNMSNQQGEGVKEHPLEQSPPPPATKIHHDPGHPPMPGQGTGDTPLRFSILVGENQLPPIGSGDSGGGGGVGQPVPIMNSTNMDLDHIVIPGKKGQFESSDSDASMNLPNSSSTISGAPVTATSSPTGSSYMDSNYLDSGPTTSQARSVGRTRDTNKRNASYEQTFDTLPSSSTSSEIHINDNQQQQQHDDMSTSSGNHHLQVNEHLHSLDHHHAAVRSPSHRQPQQQHSHTAVVGSESAASHDCQIESSRSRLQAIIWTGSIVISLNVCLVLLSLVLYFRKVHSRQNSHSIVGSSSDFGTSTRSGGLSRLGGAGSVLSGDLGGGGGGGGSGRGRLGGGQWPSVILKSKSKLGTSLNAHEHFFCKLNTKPGAGAIGGGSSAGLEHDFNWPNLSTSSSHSTISSLASGPLPSTSIRINQMRPSLKSVPFDAHSSLRSGNFDTTATNHHHNHNHGEADHEKNEYTARYTNNIDVLHNERF